MRVADLQPEHLQLAGLGGDLANLPAGALAEPGSAEAERLRGLLVFEEQLWQSGVALAAGLDEVGRGPIAGPVVAAAVIWRPGVLLAGVNDSKKLSAKKRYALEPLIRQAAAAWAIGAVGVHDIDRYNILQATKMAMLKALHCLPLRPDCLLLDAIRLDCPQAQVPLVKGDTKSISIAAASILAKCHRDRMMQIYAERYPDYKLGQHAGYPTREHKQKVFDLGPSPIHRRSFVLKPLKPKEEAGNGQA